MSYSPFPRKLSAALKGFEEKGCEGAKPKYKPLCCLLVLPTKVVKWMGGEEVVGSRETDGRAGEWRGGTSSAYLLIQIL